MEQEPMQDTQIGPVADGEMDEARSNSDALQKSVTVTDSEGRTVRVLPMVQPKRLSLDNSRGGTGRRQYRQISTARDF